MKPIIQRLKEGDVLLMHNMLTLFAAAFDEPDTYNNHRPDIAYINGLLNDRTFIAIVALEQDQVVGGLVAYELRKFEQKRSEIYIYDLAVDTDHRRRGVATQMISYLAEHASEIGAHAVFVQADKVDAPAISLYRKLGKEEDVFHYDINKRN